jgi:hypothetical protein
MTATYHRRASVFTCSLLLGAAWLFAACGNSPDTVGVSAGAGGSGAANSGAGAAGKSTGGSSSNGLCGGIACTSDQICCGPSECGRCISATSGQFCEEQCPAGGGAAGSAGAGGSVSTAGSGGGVSCGPSQCQSSQKCCDSTCGICSIGDICPAIQCPAAGGAGGASAGGTGGASAGGTGGTSAGGTGGTSAGTGGDSSGVNCRSVKPSAFPTFDRSCSTLTDCAAVVHRVDCCGTHVITGISSSELARFNAAEQICDPEYPACGCAESPTLTDTGQTATSTSEPVECLTGTCTTYVP